MPFILYFLYINLISVSIFFNTLTGGKPYQTFSARNWELKRAGKRNVVSFIDAILWFDEDHCMECWIRWKIGYYAILTYDNSKEIRYDTLRHRETNTSRL